MNSIKKKLTAIILIGVLIPFIAYNLINHFYTLNNLEKSTVSRNSDLTKALSGTISEFFDKTYSVTEEIASYPEIGTMKLEVQKKLLEDVYKRNDFLRLIFITDKSGMQIARSSGIVLDKSNKFWFQNIKRELRPFTTDAYFSDKDNSVVVSVAYPILQKDELDGVLIAEVDLDAIKDKFTGFESKSGAIVYITDNAGNVIFQSDTSKDLKDRQNLITKQKAVLINDSKGDVLLDTENNQSVRQDDYYVSQDVSAAAKEAVGGEAGGKIYQDDKTKVKKILSYAPVKIRGVAGYYSVIVLEEYDYAMKFALTTLRNAFFAGTIQLIILLILSFYISKMIADPMHIITEGVRAIKNGRLEHRITIKGNDEFSELGNAYNGMASNLMDSYEQQIRKNRELKGTNMELEASNSQLLAAIKQLNETEDNLRNAFKKTVQGLISAVEAKDLYTESHSIRVANYSVALAEKMGYGIRMKEDLWIAGVLHDIGKIGITDVILNKVGKLTDEEYKEIKQHPVIACKMLARIDLSREIMEAIRYHHERCDGKGYPDCLSAKEIPQMASIISVADAFDAITSTRAYRKSRTLSEGIDEIVANAGTQFNIEVVSAMIKLFKDKDDILQKIHDDDNLEMPI